MGKYTKFRTLFFVQTSLNPSLLVSDESELVILVVSASADTTVCGCFRLGSCGSGDVRDVDESSELESVNMASSFLIST